jgi:thiol-disulfide isomerase/thioredoxin
MKLKRRFWVPLMAAALLAVLAIIGPRWKTQSVQFEAGPAIEFDQLPPEVAAALREAMEQTDKGEQGVVRKIELSGEQAAAFLRLAEAGQSTAATERRGRTFPETLVSLDAGTISSRGQPTLVNFWATWCAPCIAELPLLEALEAEGEYRVITINNDFDRQHLDDWLAANPLSLPIHYDAGNALAAQFGVNSWPTSLLLDEHGVVLRDFVGEVPKTLDALKATLASR